MTLSYLTLHKILSTNVAFKYQDYDQPRPTYQQQQGLLLDIQTLRHRPTEVQAALAVSSLPSMARDQPPGVLSVSTVNDQLGGVLSNTKSS